MSDGQLSCLSQTVDHRPFARSPFHAQTTCVGSILDRLRIILCWQALTGIGDWSQGTVS